MGFTLVYIADARSLRTAQRTDLRVPVESISGD